MTDSLHSSVLGDEHEDVVAQYRERRRDVAENLSPWMEEAAEDLAFASGEQWGRDALATMTERKRPALTFNQIAPLIDTISGNEMSNRFEPKFLARTTYQAPEQQQQQQPGAAPQLPPSPSDNDQPVNDVVNQVVRYFRDRCQAGHEESQSFRQTAACGVGCAETTYDVRKDPKGAVITRHVDVKEMAWDPAATSQNLEDAQYVMRCMWIPRSEAVALFGEEVAGALTSAGDRGDEFKTNSIPTVNRDNSFRYSAGTNFYDADRRRVLVVEYQWIESEPAYLVRGDGEPRVLSGVEYEGLVARLQDAEAQGFEVPELDIQRTSRECAYHAFFSGDHILSAPEKLNTDGKFTYRFMTGFRDDSGSLIRWRGIVHRVKDPQRWANKFLSQIVEIIGHNPKGTLLHSKGAFENPNAAKQAWASAGAMIEVTSPSRLNEIKTIDQPQIPPAAAQMVQLCWDVIPNLVGISPYMSGGGVDDLRRTPSSSIQAMQQAGMTVLSPLFDGLSRYRKTTGELYLSILREYVDEGVMVRVVDSPRAQYVPFAKDVVAAEFDVVVHENPSSPTGRAAVWKTFTDQGFLQMFPEQGIPIPPAIVDMIPDLPEHVREEMRNGFKMVQARMMAMMQQQEQAPQGGAPQDQQQQGAPAQ